MEATGAPQRAMVDPVDLTNDAALVRVLLDDTRIWRQRLTEELLFGAYDVVRVRSQYQLELTTGLLLDNRLIQAPARSVRAILPLTTRPKASLLGFNISGPDGVPARLLPRRDIAAFEAAYLQELWESGPVGGVPPDEGLMEAIVGFHPGRYRMERAGEVLKEEGLSRYLSENLGFPVPVNWVRSWSGQVSVVQDHLRQALSEPADPWSAAENPLMALATRVPRPASLDEAGSVMVGYLDAVLAAASVGDIDFLEALAEYGRRWEVLVETEIPLDQPVVVTLAEDRPLRFKGSATSVHLALGDAASYHLEARLSDHAVEFGGTHYRALGGCEIPTADLEDRQKSPHSLALYSSLPARSYYAELHVTLRLSRDQRLASRLVVALIALALVVAAFGRFSSSVAEAMAVLTVPTTFAATVVLTRPGSPLAARLALRFRRVLALLVFLLWSVAVAQLLTAAALPERDETSGYDQPSSTEGSGNGEKRSPR